MKQYNIYNKVKTLATAAIMVAGALATTGCDDFLEVEPQNQITLENFWNQKSDVENVITSCYTELTADGTIRRMMAWGEFRSENTINNGKINKDVDLERLLQENIDASNGYTYWGYFYTVINRCNIVLHYAPEVARKDPAYTESMLKAHVAEVTALRSLCYFYLMRAFRDVPYSDEAFLDDSQQLEQPATPFNELLDKLIASLEVVKDDAVRKYTLGSGDAQYYNTGRVTKTFIYALLADMYLWKQDYANCVRYADLVIEEKKKEAETNTFMKSLSTYFPKFNGYPLIPSQYPQSKDSYGYAFSQIFGFGNSPESIFELYFDKNSTDNKPSNTSIGTFFGTQTKTPLVIAPDKVSMGQITAGDDSKFDKRNGGYDGRAYENVRFAAKNPKYINKYSTMGNVILQKGKDCYTDDKNMVYTAQYPVKNNVPLNKANFIIYRLTDVMLLKAEALTLMIGSNDITTGSHDDQLRTQAFDLVDAVNKRSLMTDEYDKYGLLIKNVKTKADLLNLVYAERERELMFEGKRYFDLVRRSMRENSTSYLASQVSGKGSGSLIQDKLDKIDAIFWPYNLNEMKVNKYLKQNPAFPSGENQSYK